MKIEIEIPDPIAEVMEKRLAAAAQIDLPEWLRRVVTQNSASVLAETITVSAQEGQNP